MGILSKEKIEMIHEATLKVLEETGYIIKNKEVLDNFKKAGASVDYKKELVKIPRELVLNAIKTAPSKLTLYGKKNSKVELGKNEKIYFMNGYGTVNVFDWRTKKRRPNTKKDLKNYVRIIDKMENCAIYYNEVTPQDLPSEIMDRHNAQVVLEYTEKPCFLEAWSMDGLKDIFSMLKSISGENWISKPIACFQLCTISPLIIDAPSSERMVEIAKQGLPLVFGSLPQAGATAPATLAGTLVILNAEALGGLTLTQLINPGTPFILNNYAAAMDQQYGVFASGGPEMSLMQAAMAQLIHYYGMLQIGTCGGTESNSIDVQAGMEKAFSTLYTALNGVELIHGAVSGWVQSLLSHCPAMAVIANEMCGHIYKLLEGVNITEETLEVDIIREIGPAGNFLTHQSTLDNFKKESWLPKLIRRMNAQVWEDGGRKELLDYAQEKVDKILNEETVSYISDSAKEEIDGIVRKAELELNKKNN